MDDNLAAYSRADFLRTSRGMVDDTVVQHLNALVTPSREVFDSSMTANRQTQPSSKKPVNARSCEAFKNDLLFQSWQSRSDVLNYCAGVALDPNDPDLLLLDVESAKERERVADERLDPYSNRHFPREARTESLASLIRNERSVEAIVRARTWSVVLERCGDPGIRWEEAINTWRAQKESRSESQ